MEAELNSDIKKLTKVVNKSNSLWLAFFRGIFYGLGFFIGSAILAAVLIYILSRLQGWAYIGDVIQKILNIAGKTQS